MLRNRFVRRKPAKNKLIPLFKNFDLDSVPKPERMTFLLKIAQTGMPIPKSNLVRLRAYFERNKAKMLPMKGVLCWVCDLKADHRHHVVPLGRGGGNNKKNLVPLCNQCHTIIHPWMAQKA